jgi:hypothetical protein
LNDLGRVGKELPDALQQVSTPSILDPIVSIPHSRLPDTNIVKGYDEAIHLLLNFQQGSRNLAMSPNSQSESDAIGDYLNLRPQEDGMKERSRNFVSSNYSKLVQESSARFDPPFMSQVFSRGRPRNGPYYFGDPEPIQNANVAQPSKKRKAEEINGAQSPSKPRKRGARVKLTFKRGQAPPSGEAILTIKPPPSGQTAAASESPPPGEAPTADEASDLYEDTEVDEAPPPKKVKAVETAAQKAFKKDRLEARVLDVSKCGLLERGTLGEMMRLSKHVIPICSEGLLECNTVEERVALTYMTEGQLGWQLVRDPGTRDGFRVGRPDEVADGVYKPRERKPREYKPRENKPRVAPAVQANGGRRRAGMRTRSGAGGHEDTEGTESGEREIRRRGSPSTTSVSSATATEKETSKCDSPGKGTQESVGESV